MKQGVAIIYTEPNRTFLFAFECSTGLYSVIAHFLLEASKGRMIKWVIFPADKHSPSIILDFIEKNISNKL